MKIFILITEFFGIPISFVAYLPQPVLCRVLDGGTPLFLCVQHSVYKSLESAFG